MIGCVCPQYIQTQNCMRTCPSPFILAIVADESSSDLAAATPRRFFKSRNPCTGAIPLSSSAEERPFRTSSRSESFFKTLRSFSPRLLLLLLAVTLSRSLESPPVRVGFFSLSLSCTHGQRWWMLACARTHAGNEAGLLQAHRPPAPPCPSSSYLPFS